MTLTGNVLAATFSYRDQSLYVLDRHHAICDDADDDDDCENSCDDQVPARIRFMRIDALAGPSTVLASFPANDLPEQVWLGSDLDGEVLFSFSSQNPKRYSIVRYDVDSGSITKLKSGSHALAMPVLADPNGFVVYTKRPQGAVHGDRFNHTNESCHPLSELSWLL